MFVNGSIAPRTLGLVGAKGGVGTTVAATSLAWALSQRGLRVVLLDLDLRSGQAALHLCERNAGPTVGDAMRVMERLDDTLLDTLLTPCSPSLRLLPAPRDWAAWPDGPDEDASALLKLLRTATELADWVVLDLPAGAMSSAHFGPLLCDLQEVALVTEPTLPATFNARRAWQWLQDHRSAPGANTLLLNKVQRHTGLPSEQVRRTLGLDGAADAWRELPRSDAAVAQATYQGQAVGAVDPKDAWSRAVSRWASELEQRRCSAAPTTTAPTAEDGPTVPTQPAAAAAPRPWHERLLRWAP